MENKHHTSFIKQLLRGLLGVLLSVGFGALWLGIFKGNSDLIIFGVLIYSLGIFHIILSFLSIKKWHSLASCQKKKANKY